MSTTDNLYILDIENEPHSIKILEYFFVVNKPCCSEGKKEPHHSNMIWLNNLTKVFDFTFNNFFFKVIMCKSLHFSIKFNRGVIC